MGFGSRSVMRVIGLTIFPNVGSSFICFMWLVGLDLRAVGL